jgi:hypothetical protein
VTHYPDFPLYAEDFTAIILWIVGLIVGGWGLGSMYKNVKLKKAGYEYNTLVRK